MRNVQFVGVKVFYISTEGKEKIELELGSGFVKKSLIYAGIATVYISITSTLIYNGKCNFCGIM